jgi:hypothetical protein
MDHGLTFEKLLDDPLIRLVRASDRISDSEFVSLMCTVREALDRRAVASTAACIQAAQPGNVLAFRQNQASRSA